MRKFDLVSVAEICGIVIGVLFWMTSKAAPELALITTFAFSLMVAENYVPWRYREWQKATDEGGEHFKAAIRNAHLLLSGALFFVGLAAITVGFCVQNGPSWLESAAADSLHSAEQEKPHDLVLLPANSSLAVHKAEDEHAYAALLHPDATLMRPMGLVLKEPAGRVADAMVRVTEPVLVVIFVVGIILYFVEWLGGRTYQL